MRSQEQILSAWSLIGIHITHQVTFKSIGGITKSFPKRRRDERTRASSHKREGRIVVYREYFRKLLDTVESQAPLRDKLLVELPTLEALRTGEVSSIKWEYFDFDHGILQVLDSKKDTFRFIPLFPKPAKHAIEYMEYRRTSYGYLFMPETNVGRPRKQNSKARGIAISESHINRIWEKWCYLSGIPAMSPRMGRKHFACVWVYGDEYGRHKKSMRSLQAILGHDDIRSTEHYLPIDFDQILREAHEGEDSPFISECDRSDKCAGAIEGCKCKFFMPKLEVKQ